MSMLLKEARIILVSKGDSDNSVPDALGAIREAFGGFTAFRGVGSWVDDEGVVHTDKTIIVDIAVSVPVSPPGHLVSVIPDKLRKIAADYRKASGEQAVYLRLPTGSVEFIT